jgi:plasmid stabilization system protein ParE
MRIRWTLPAADDLENILTYLQQNHPHLQNPLCAQSTGPPSENFSEPGQTGPSQRHKRASPYASAIRCRLFRESGSCRNLHIYHGAQDWR